MNKWIRRTAGTVGIAGGALLLGTAAHADNPVIADPQSLHGLTDTANVDDGLGGVGVSVDTPGQRDTVGLLPDGGGPVRSGTNNGELGAVVHAPTQDGQPRDVFANGRTPDIFQALPITDVVPMDGLGMPRTLPASASAPARESLEATGLPVRNLPIGTGMAGDALGGDALGGDRLAQDGFAGNGLGVPLGDQLPLGAARNLGGSPLGGLPLVGSPGSADASGGGRTNTTPTAQSARNLGSPVFSGDAVQVLPTEALGALSESFAPRSESFAPRSESFAPRSESFAPRSLFAARSSFATSPAGRHRAEAGIPGAGLSGGNLGGGLPSSGGLPVVGGVLQGGTLPTKANVNTLPGAPAVPVHDLLAPGTAATGASAGNTFDQTTGAVNNLAQNAGGSESLPGTESLPISDEALPVVGGLTGPSGTRGMPLPDTSGIPVVGGVADGLTGGKHRAQYAPRHSA